MNTAPAFGSLTPVSNPGLIFGKATTGFTTVSPVVAPFRPFSVRIRRAKVVLFGLCALSSAWIPSYASEPSTLPPTPNQTRVIVAVGAAGEEEFGRDFEACAAAWAEASASGGASQVTIGLPNSTPQPRPPASTPAGQEPDDLQRLRQLLQDEPRESPAELWIVLIGHGTFDGREARFNLRGPDLGATELAGWLKPFKRPLVIIDGSSSSSPFLNKLSGPGRVVITATRSGHEQNYSRFGSHLARALIDPAADLDKDRQVSVLEAFIMASRRLVEWYDADGRLATEHPLLDDNGDGAGTPADWFRGVRAVKKADGGAGVDGTRAHQVHLVRSVDEQKLGTAERARRDELEAALSKLRESKTSLPQDEYFQRLETLMLELSRIYISPPKPAP